MNKEKLYYLLTALHSFRKRIFNRLDNSQIEKILIVKQDELGDLITALPALQKLRETFSNSEISLFVKPYLKEIAEAQNVANIVISSSTELKKQYSLILELRGNWEFRKQRRKIKHRYFLDRGSVRFRNKFFRNQHPHEVDTNFEIIQYSGLDLGERKEQKSWLKWKQRNEKVSELFLQRSVIGKYVVLHAGARKRLRQWHPSKFAKIAYHLIEEKGLDVIFVGADEDRREISSIQEKIGKKTYSFAGEGSILDFAALVSKAEFMLGNESGPMHVAAACGTPVIALFGPGEAHVFRPFGKVNLVLHHKLECNPCDQVNCKYAGDPCINRISLDEVKTAVCHILNNSDPQII